jgi:hypothetical protein
MPARDAKTIHALCHAAAHVYLAGQLADPPQDFLPVLVPAIAQIGIPDQVENWYTAVADLAGGYALDLGQPRLAEIQHEMQARGGRTGNHG